MKAENIANQILNFLIDVVKIKTLSSVSYIYFALLQVYTLSLAILLINKYLFSLFGP